MGIEDLVGKGKALFEQNKEKVEGTLRSEQAEGVSDAVLDRAAQAAKAVLPDTLDDRIDGVRDKLDGAIGNE